MCHKESLEAIQAVGRAAEELSWACEQKGALQGSQLMKNFGYAEAARHSFKLSPSLPVDMVDLLRKVR